MAQNGTSGPVPQDVRTDIGELLREWRERALLTQEQLAERAGLSVRSIRRYERGGAAGRPQSTTIRLLVDALGLDAGERAVLVAAARGPAQGDPAEPPPPSAAPPVRLRQLPGPPPLFTGRDPELADLERISDPERLVIVTIGGMAGVGKTTLAVQAAHRVAERYPDEQIYLDLHGYARGVRPVEPGEALERVLRSLGVPADRIPPDPEDRAALYRSRLADHRALILLDNAASEAQVAPLLPGTSGCLVLVTSRRCLTGLDHSHALSLDLLPRSDAVTLFRLAVGDQRLSGEQPGRLAEIVDLCGRLPLAVRIAAARLRSRPSWTIAHLVERLAVRKHVLAELETGERSVTAALDLSYQQLPPDERRAYRTFGLNPGTELTVHAAAALLDTTVREAERLVDRLLDSHLLQEPTLGRYRFHDLVRTHSIATAEADEPAADRHAALTRLFDHYRHSAAVAMDVAYPYERARRPHVPPSGRPAPVPADPGSAITWLDTELATLLAVARYAADHGRPEHTLHLSDTLHRYLRGRGHYSTAETLHNLALTVARATGDRLAEQFALVGLGHTYRQQGRNGQASAHYTQALAIARSIGNRSAEMWTLNGLGHIHRLQGRYTHAAENFTLARQIAQETGNRSAELDALTGLGWLHRQQGLKESAITYFEQALDIARAIGNRHGELNAMNGLASTHRLQGRHEHATETYRQTLALSREIGNRNLQFEALQGLGRLHFTAGRHEESLSCHREALDLATHLRQPADQANAHDGLAQAHHALGRREDARTHWQLALDTLTEIGAEHTEDGETTTSAVRDRLRELADG